jgi:hypothetical protein
MQARKNLCNLSTYSENRLSVRIKRITGANKIIRDVWDISYAVNSKYFMNHDNIIAQCIRIKGTKKK